ncbi:Rhodopirellula transposase [Tautonia plasticadhaerens]|uniref:Rhodopirellula transposase n=1 Tax=Tautonia plasticadhaerens TaxID=2527974 RepID=A0A518H0N5_9BACT|nr:Rhodopirellula transposase [Tautonia plasticadhaerens]
MLGPDRVSRRRACKVLGQARSTQRRAPAVPDDEARLVARMVELACEYGRYGHRRVTALLRAEGFDVNRKRLGRLWRREGLKVPAKQPKRGRLWLNDGSCVRLRPGHKDHARSYDFVQARTRDGRAFRMRTVIDEHTRECLAIAVARELKADGGGSNGSRRRLWKVELQGLADETGLSISACHFPPGTSKWNEIEHRMFCHITGNWRGRPLVSREVVVDLIGSTRTKTGLEIRAELDVGSDPVGRGAREQQMEGLPVKREKFHGEWNYTIRPRE